jgi:hypothetical protein
MSEKSDDIALISLSQGRYAIVDAEIVDQISQWTWTYSKDNRHSNPNYGYAATTAIVDGKKCRLLMHRVIANTPSGLTCDHINGDPLDNRRSNLRNISRAKNLRNRGLFKNNASGHKGIQYVKENGRWRVNIKVSFESLEDALRVVEEVERITHGVHRRAVGSGPVVISQRQLEELIPFAIPKRRTRKART